MTLDPSAKPGRSITNSPRPPRAPAETAQGLLKEGAAFVELGRADNMLPYGDYYYMEALMRAVGHSDFFW